MDFTPLLDQARASAHNLLAIVSNPSEFSWAAQPPMSDWRSAAAALALYFGSIFALRGFVKYVRGGRALPGAQFLFGCHNFLMSAMSLLMFVGAAYELTQRSLREGSLVWSACEAPGTKATGALYFWSYMYYLSKFVEFLDTIYLAAKGSELTFFQGWSFFEFIILARFDHFLSRSAFQCITILSWWSCASFGWKLRSLFNSAACSSTPLCTCSCIATLDCAHSASNPSGVRWSPKFRLCSSFGLPALSCTPCIWFMS
jgi:hypothetical protein